MQFYRRIQILFYRLVGGNGTYKLGLFKAMSAMETEVGHWSRAPAGLKLRRRVRIERKKWLDVIDCNTMTCMESAELDRGLVSEVPFRHK